MFGKSTGTTTVPSLPTGNLPISSSPNLTVTSPLVIGSPVTGSVTRTVTSVLLATVLVTSASTVLLRLVIGTESMV